MSSVHFWTAENHDGCSYYRGEVPAEALNQAGHSATVGISLPAEAMREGHTVVAQRLHMPAPAALWHSLGDVGVRRVFEVDDDLWHLPPEHPSAAWYAQTDVRRMLDIVISQADAVTVSTDPLAEVLREHTDAPVTTIPNYIPRWFLDQGADNRRERTTWPGTAVPYTVGWAGSMTRSNDWTPGVVRMVNRWVQRNPEDRVRIYGGKDWGIERADVVEWITGVEEYIRTVFMDVMLIPLVHNEFNRSKSHIKALECMALGIVPIVWDEQPYREIITHGVDGFRAINEHHAREYLDLLRDGDFRTMLSDNGRATASWYVIDDHIGEWEKVLWT